MTVLLIMSTDRAQLSPDAEIDTVDLARKNRGTLVASDSCVNSELDLNCDVAQRCWRKAADDLDK
jgi:hypothetical protein